MSDELDAFFAEHQERMRKAKISAGAICGIVGDPPKGSRTATGVVQQRAQAAAKMSAPGVICPDCGAQMVLRETKKYRWKNGQPRKFYGCSRWPACRAAHGAHPDGRPLGIPGNKETKEARIRAHDAFDGMAKRLGWSRTQAYNWLRHELKMTREEAHIGRMEIWQCEKVIQLCQE